MSMINYASREINCKLVYYGPGLGGKTTNLEYIYEKVAPASKGKMISLATETERTLFFDFLPVDLGTIRGFKTPFHLYTVPGQVYYNASRRLILKGVGGAGVLLRGVRSPGRRGVRHAARDQQAGAEDDRMTWTVPNILTLARIAITPLVAALPFIEGYWPKLLCFVIFVAAAVTDVID